MQLQALDLVPLSDIRQSLLVAVEQVLWCKIVFNALFDKFGRTITAAKIEFDI